MNRSALLAVAFLVIARGAAAQVTPPNIRKPIETAKKAAAATSAQVQNSQKTGDAPSTRPAEAAQAASKGKAVPVPDAATAKAAADRKAAEQKAAAADSASRRGSASQRGAKATVTFSREAYEYDDEGRPDPFLSPMATGELKPLLVDLALIGVVYDHSGSGRSSAVLVDASSNETWRVKVNDIIGRMKVIKIGEKDITFSIDEFGFSRQETLLLDMNSRKAGAAPGRRPQ